MKKETLPNGMFLGQRGYPYFNVKALQQCSVVCSCGLSTGSPKELLEKLKYKVEPYPKTRIDAGS